MKNINNKVVHALVKKAAMHLQTLVTVNNRIGYHHTGEVDSDSVFVLYVGTEAKYEGEILPSGHISFDDADDMIESLKKYIKSTRT